jgi:recombination protein RecT
MSEPTQAMQKGPTEGTLKWYLQQPAYKERFNQMLGERASQFMASIINTASAKNFEGVEPRSILAAAAVAATLNLPIDKNLGFAWIIPYKNMATFQIGYKGYIQLALRSCQYAGMNAVTVNAEALAGYDAIGDPIIDWGKLDETKPAVGYAFAWRLTTGFTKIAYWSKEKMVAHAERYSQAYRAGRKDSPWFTNFDMMALKTLIGNSLRKWGILSIEMQTALERDQSAAIDIEASPIYVDNEQNGDSHAMREMGDEDDLP